MGAAGLSTWKSRNYLQVRVQLWDTQVSPAWHVGNSACIWSEKCSVGLRVMEEVSSAVLAECDFRVRALCFNVIVKRDTWY